MNTTTLLTISALTLGLLPVGLAVRADDAMSGMDMGGTKMPARPKPAALSVAAAVSPAAPRTGDNALDLTILDAAGKPATGLTLTASVAMTSMDMGTAHPAVTEKGGGHYALKAAFTMDGPWRVVVRNGGTKVAVLDFEAGAKTPWKPSQVKAALGTSSAPAAPAVAAMPGMDMGGAAGFSGADAPKSDTPASPHKATGSGDMAGMDMGGAGMSGMKTGIADMKTATMPELQEKGTYTATGSEDWKVQAGFGHNSGMVGMMNQMMVGGSGMEGMKMPAMKSDFGEKNYTPTPDDAEDSMPGMDMGGGKKAASGGGMPGTDMGAASPAAKRYATASLPPATITATTDAAPKAGDNPLTISVTDTQGKPVTGANVSASVAMTSMDMGTTHPVFKDIGGGKYRGKTVFSMAGPWRVTVKVAAPGQKPFSKAFVFSAK